MRIAHTADVHWRGLSRHEEYREVFESFFKDCKDNEVDHIFVGGDIFHTKTSGISPEYIEQLTWWLESMSKIAHVHLILGNHDGNLINLSRQDAVTPVVGALNNSRIHLYKKSGVYEFSPGYNWCVFSPFDEENWELVKPINGKINIACFHGPVNGSTTETGWNIEGDGKRVDFFDEYNFALLGDIHKRQMLAYRSGKPWIGYPGSPVQQNYAEDIDRGYLLWEIKSKDEWEVQFRPLPNIKPFVTLKWLSNLDDIKNEALKYPKGSRFRIKTNDHLSQKDIHLISSFLKTKLVASEVTFKSDAIIDRTVLKAGVTELVKTDLRSPDVLLKLVKEHHKSSVISDDLWTEVGTSIKSLLTTAVSNEDTLRNSKWSIRHLSFDNLFSYGEENIINFDNLSGIVGIFGPNRIGKSSVVGTIMYSLFNTTDRGPMKNIHVCNIRKQYCSSRAVINHNGTDYVIERQTTKSENKKGVVNASTALNLYKMREDGELDELNGEQRNDTEKTIRSLVGTSEDFLLTSLSAQGEVNQFISQGSTKRRAILSRFLDLDIFDKMHELANKEASGLKYQLKNYPDKDWNGSIELVENELNVSLKKLEETQIDLDDQRNQLTSIQNELLSLNVTPVSLEQLKSQEKKVENLVDSCRLCSEKISLLEKEVEDFINKIASIREVKSDYDIDDLRSKKSSYDAIESTLVLLRHSFEKEENILKQHQKSLKILEGIPCNDEFPTCKFIKDANVSKEKFPSQLKIVEDAKSKIDTAVKMIDDIKGSGSIDKLNKLEKLIDLEKKLELEMSRKETEVARLKSSCELQCADLSREKDVLRKMKEAIENEENIAVINLRSKLEKLSTGIRDLETGKLKLATQCGKLTSDKEKLEEERARRNEILENLKVHDIISSAFSKKGIPLAVTKSQLPVINAEISRILHGIVDFSIELENDEDTDSTEIYINYGDSKRIIELCSGMEKTISSLAIRVAMINVSTLPRSDIFIIDEGFGTLDDSAVESCSRFLSSLKRYFKSIIVITHVDGIKDSADHIIEITKFEKDAKVIFGGN